jgi:hypothetical protein
MPQPIPFNSIRPLQVGECVQIVPEWQDLGDEEFACVVIEAPADSPRVLIGRGFFFVKMLKSIGAG